MFPQLALFLVYLQAVSGFARAELFQPPKAFLFYEARSGHLQLSWPCQRTQLVFRPKLNKYFSAVVSTTRDWIIQVPRFQARLSGFSTIRWIRRLVFLFVP